ncbi:MAG TPA: S41 family peptidase [Anaerolineales bacterium]|nr:S41 family peptidase [Anaerolineales bacterium]
MKTKRLLIAVAFLFTLACTCNNLSVLPFAPSTPSSPPATATATLLPPTATPPYIPDECVGQPVATIPAVTLTAEPTLSIGTNPPLTKGRQLAVFQELTAPIPSLYVYPDFNGLDWPATVAKYRAKVESGLDTETFYTEMQNMINELNDDHSRFESPAEVAATNAQLAGNNNYVGIGVEILPLPDKGKITILLVFPGSAAEHAGLQQHDSLLAVDGIPLVQNGVVHSEWVRGPACSAAVLTVQTPGQAPRDITVLRYSVKSSVPIIARLVPTQDGSRIGYIFLPSYFDETLPGQVKQALEQFGPLDGLILDNRMNSGGSSDVVEPIMGYFTGGVLGHFASRTSQNPFQVTADPINNSQTVPMVVLVGTGTVSFGEITSGVLQDIGRAKVVGQTTLGNMEILFGHDLSDGSRLWLAQERFVPLHSKADWEKTGIVPDVQAYADWDTFTFANDPSVAAALTLLGHK